MRVTLAKFVKSAWFFLVNNLSFITLYLLKNFHDILFNQVALQSISIPDVCSWLMADFLHKVNYAFIITGIAEDCSHNIPWLELFNEENF